MPDGTPGPGLPDHTEVAVVGGGIAGSATAFHLAEVGLKVAILERGRIGGGATGAAVGVLSPPLRQPFHETARAVGTEGAAEIWRFALRSVAGLGALLGARELDREADLDLRGGYVLAEPHTHHDLERSYDGLAAAGLPVSPLSGEQVRALTRGQGFSGGFRIEGLGALRPDRTARLLSLEAARAGATIHEEVTVREVTPAGAGFRVDTSAGTLHSDRVVHAAHVDSRAFLGLVDQEVVPIRGQGFVTAPLPPRFPGAFSTHWKLNVWRQDSDGRLHVSGWRNDAWERSYRETDPRLDPRLQEDLVRWFESAFRDLAPLTVENRWSGLFGWTRDFLPLVGPIPDREGEYAITGFSGGGLPFAFECGRVVAHHIVGLPPIPGHELFAPDRFATH